MKIGRCAIKTVDGADTVRNHTSTDSDIVHGIREEFLVSWSNMLANIVVLADYLHALMLDPYPP
jgi:hypothetical protein